MKIISKLERSDCRHLDQTLSNVFAYDRGQVKPMIRQMQTNQEYRFSAGDISVHFND